MTWRVLVQALSWVHDLAWTAEADKRKYNLTHDLLSTCSVAYDAWLTLHIGPPDPVRAADQLALAVQRFLPMTAFSLLERVLREACRQSVDADGTVLRGYKVGYKSYKPGNRISSMRDLTLLITQRYATADLAGDVQAMLPALPLTDAATHVDRLYRERNRH